MIPDETMQRLLTTAAQRYDVPPGAVDRILAVAADSGATVRPRRVRLAAVRRHPLPIAAGALGVVVVLFLALAFVGGGTGTTSGGPARLPLLGSGSSNAAGTTAAGPGSGDGGGKVAAQRSEAVPPVDTTRIVRTGSVDLQVRNNSVTPTLDRVSGFAAAFGGFVASSQSDANRFAPSGEVVLRIPVTNFDRAIADIRRLGKQVEVTTSSKDVTGQYVDLSARLTALRATRVTYLTILSHATTIGETLSVQQRLDDVQQQIEQLQGQRQLLANQAALSTVTVDVHGPGQSPPATTAHRSGWSHAWHTAVARFNRGVQGFIGALGPIALALIALVLVLLLGRLGYRVLRRRLV